MWGNSKYPQQPSTEEEEQKNSEFTIIWEKLIEQWNPTDSKLVKCARSMTKYGSIPTSLRAEAWFIISGAAQLLKNNPNLYSKLYSSPSDKSDLIEKDLPRTWGAHPSFHTRKGSQHCLRRILIAYSNFDPSLGYCQGMNYIAGFLLHIFKGNNEEQAFWTFVVILRQVRSIFIDGLPGFHKIVYYFRKLCSHHLPKLHEQWESLGIDVYKLILTPWFHSLFSYPCLDIGHTARIWDLFLIHDFSICVKIAFTIIASNERKLSKMEFVDIIDFCKFLPCMKYGGKQLIQKSISIKLNEKYLNYTRDLTKFDWQINKQLKKEYIKHKRKRLRKEKEKLKIEQKYKALYAQKLAQQQQQQQNDNDQDNKCNDNDNDHENHNDNIISKQSSHSLALPSLSISTTTNNGNNDESESVISVSVSMSESSTVLGLVPPMTIPIPTSSLDE